MLVLSPPEQLFLGTSQHQCLLRPRFDSNSEGISASEVLRDWASSDQGRVELLLALPARPGFLR